MTHLTALLRKPQKIIFEMGNLVDETYTGSFNATLTATYYSPLGISPAHPANLVLPISHQRSDKGQPSHFSLPGQRAISSLELPKNSIRAVVSVSASGNGAEEFWYTNVPNAYTRTFGKNALPGYGPYREIQVLVDGKVAGFVWPFTTIFTGGFVPSLWSPIVAPTAFDLPEYEVDITPFLPQLLSGDGEHTIEFVIFSYDSTTKALSRDLGNDWLVSGRVFVWTDPDEDWVTTGSLLQHDVSQPFFNFLPIIELDSQGNNKSIQLSLSTYNNIAVLSTINTSTGKFSAFWLQGLRYESSTKLLDGGYKQFISTSTAVTETTVAYGTRRYRYSLGLDTAFTPRKDWSGFDVVADINIGINVAGSGKWVDGNRIGDGKMGTQFEGHSTWGSNRAGGGVSSQVWGEVRPPRDEESVGSYARRVDAVGGDLVKDWESINGVEKTVVDYGDYEAVWGPEAEERLEMERLWVV